MESDDSLSYEDSLSGVESSNESSSDEAGVVRAGLSTSSLGETADEDSFEVLSVVELTNYMLEEIKEVKDVAMLPDNVVLLLMNHFKWNKERLVERLFESDQERLFRDASIVCPVTDQVAPASKNSKAGVINETCEICFTTHPSSCLSGLDCGHRFCVSCWSDYLTTKVMDEGMSQKISCAAHGCHLLMDEASVVRFVSDERVLRRYRHLVTNSFVECNSLLSWCPTPDCGYAVRVHSVDTRSVTCRCGHRFCFACSEPCHQPVQCQLIARWLKKCSDDSETLNWIAANTKECPKCNATIEKSGGCNHMICRNQNCKADFCWMCLGPWEPHGSSWYNCNRYDESDAKAAREAQECSRASLNRYIFYLNRYTNHIQSLKLENRLYTTAKDKMQEMQRQNLDWMGVQFLKKAVDVLCSCRQTLMHTYVFAYYLLPNNQTHIFEDNQKDLENSTEMLSEYLERDITQENIVDIKQKVQDKCRYCEQRRKVLQEHVLEGYERGWWSYID